MIAFAADENLNNDIVRALFRRLPELDLVRVQDTELSGSDDPSVLEWAAREERLLLSHDVATITKYAYERVAAGKPMPGVFEIPQSLSVREAIEDLLLIAQCSEPGEWDGQVRYLPLR